MTVEQTSDRLAIHWDSFDIGWDETVRFHQPGASSIALNRVTTLDPTTIDGQLRANGQVFLINPNGVIFGDGASVQTAGFVASTLGLEDDAFFDGTYAFNGNEASGGIVNRGLLKADGGGYVALLGTTVENSGDIVAPDGQVVLAAGESVALYLDGSGLFKAEVDGAALGAEIQNGGLIAAEDGLVLLTARSKDALVDTVINHSGIIEASSMEARGGVIVLSGGPEQGAVEVSGRLDASAPAGEGGRILVSGHTVEVGADAVIDASGDAAGGFVETSGEIVRIETGAHVTTRAASGAHGTWLIDTTDYVIAATNPLDGSSYMSHTALSDSLEEGNVEIATVEGVDGGSGLGNITVDADVTWDAATTLTLKAHNEIAMNASISATSPDSGLALLAGGYVFAIPTVQTGNVTLAAGKAIRVGTLTIGGNPDVFGVEFPPSGMGDVTLEGELHVGTLNIDRTMASMGQITANNAGNAIGRLESRGSEYFVGLDLRAGSGDLDVFLDYQDQSSMGSDIIIHTQGNLTLLEESRVSLDVNPINVVLVASEGAFINRAGAEAITLVPEEHQRFLIYSADLESTVTGGLVGLAVYGKTFDTFFEDYVAGEDADLDAISRFIYAPGEQLELIFIAIDLERFYGDPNPTLDENSWIVQGLAEGESLSDVLFGGDPTLSHTAKQDSPANTSTGYAIHITGDGLSSSKYQLRFQEGVLRVKPAPVTLNIGDTTREYGETDWDAPPLVSVTEGLKLDHTIAHLDLTLSYNQEPKWSVNSSPTPIRATIGNPNYVLANPLQGGELTITKAPLSGEFLHTVTRLYGDVLSGNDVKNDDMSWTGFKNDETPAVIFVTLDDQPRGQGVGTYGLTGTGTASNYEVTIAPGTLRIEPAPLDIVIHDATRIYGDANPDFTAEAVNLRNNDTFADVFSGVYRTDATVASGVGGYDIGLQSHTMISGNYTLRNVTDGTLTITRAKLTGTIGHVQRVYGDALTPADTKDAVTWSGFKLDDDGSVVTLTFNDHPASTDVGEYALSASAGADNYDISLSLGVLEITPAPLVGQIGDIERTYGDSLSAAALLEATQGITWSGFRNGDDASVVNVTLSDQPRTTNAGDYAFTGSATSKNYSVTLSDGMLTINPAVLHLRANDVSWNRLSKSMPRFTMTATGTKFFEPLSSLVQYTVASKIDATTDLGEHTIAIDVPDHIIPLAPVVLKVTDVLSPNYVLGDVTGGTLTIYEPNLSELCTADCDVSAFINDWLDMTLGDECPMCGMIVSISLSSLGGSGTSFASLDDAILASTRPTATLTANTETTMEAMREAFSPIFTGERDAEGLDEAYITELLNGEKSIEAWKAEIEAGSDVAKSTFMAFLPVYVTHLLALDPATLAFTERYLLDQVGQWIGYARQIAAFKLAAEASGDTSLLDLLGDRVDIIEEYPWGDLTAEEATLLSNQAIYSARDLASDGLSDAEMKEIEWAIGYLLRDSR